MQPIPALWFVMFLIYFVVTGRAETLLKLWFAGKGNTTTGNTGPEPSGGPGSPKPPATKAR